MNKLLEIFIRFCSIVKKNKYIIVTDLEIKLQEIKEFYH